MIWFRSLCGLCLMTLVCFVLSCGAKTTQQEEKREQARQEATPETHLPEEPPRARESQDAAGDDRASSESTAPFHRPWNMAHRGGLGLYPQSTIVAYSSAIKEYNVDVLEMDLQKTKDNIIVVQHDTEMRKTTNCDKNVPQLTFAEHQKCNVVAKFKPHADIPNRFKGTFHPHPSLEQMFKTFPHRLMNIEIKQHSPSLVPELVALIRKYKREKTIVVISFGSIALNEFRKAAPDIRTGLTIGESLAFLDARDDKNDWADYRAPGMALQVPADKLSAKIVRDAHSKGIEVHPWTINDKATMIKLLNMGVDGIITDRPDRMADVLKARKTNP